MTVGLQIVDYDKYPHYLGDHFKSGYRAQRIEQVIQQISDEKKITMQHMQAQTATNQARWLLSHLVSRSFSSTLLRVLLLSSLRYWPSAPLRYVLHLVKTAE